MNKRDQAWAELEALVYGLAVFLAIFPIIARWVI